MSITVRFACGHVGQVSATSDAMPVCRDCGHTQIARVKARAPRFVGACSGPYAETTMLEAVTVNLAPKGPLTLKPAED